MIGIIHISPTWKDLRNGIMSVKDLWRSQVNICLHPDRKLKKKLPAFEFLQLLTLSQNCFHARHAVSPARKTEDRPIWSMSVSWFKTNKSNPWMNREITIAMHPQGPSYCMPWGTSWDGRHTITHRISGAQTPDRYGMLPPSLAQWWFQGA